MNGPPQKPTTACSGASSPRTIAIASRIGATASSGSGTRSRSTSAAERIGSATTGPTPSTSSTSTPIATTGVMMSANITAASTLVPPHRLERHLGGQLRRLVDLEERVPLADLAVLRQRPARLPHEPHGRPLDWLAPGGADEQRIHGPTLAAHGKGAACRPLRRLDARRAAGRRVRSCRGPARERRHRPLGPGHQARLPLARRARQPDRLGRRAHTAAAARARRARCRPDTGESADPTRALPLRLRPRRRAPRLVLRARLRAGDTRRRRSSSHRRPPRRASRLGRACAGLGRAGRRRARRGLRRRRRRDRVGRRPAPPPAARARPVRAGPRPRARLRPPAALPVRHRRNRARAPPRTSRACPRTPPRRTSSRGSTTAASSSTPIRDGARVNRPSPHRRRGHRRSWCRPCW